MPRLQLLGRFLPRSLAGLAVLLVSTVPALAGAGPSAAQLQALETALNGTGELRGAMEDGPGLDVTLVELRRRSVLRQFPDARWQLTTGKPLRDGRSTVQLQVTGSRQEGPTRYRLDAQQQLVLSSSGGPGGRINGQIVIREQTLMRSGEADLPVSLLIPDAVLTGWRRIVQVGAGSLHTGIPDLGNFAGPSQGHRQCHQAGAGGGRQDPAGSLTQVSGH